MKSAAFDYARPSTIREATALLAAHPGAKILAGGQTLGPMLNLRLVRPSLLIDITRIPELTRIEESDGAIVLGACITHASIEDGRVPDPAGGAMQRVARGIAYRAIRTRGTIGGSLAHADPAADWLSVLVALGADALVSGPAGRRAVPIGSFAVGALTTSLGPGEIVDGVRIPRLTGGAQLGYAKLCRKTGEFAHAIGVAIGDRDRRSLRLVAGAMPGPPVVFDSTHDLLDPSSGAGGAWVLDRLRTADALRRAGCDADAYHLNVHVAALERAVGKVLAQ